ncbi:periplasmic sensor diguanylate cyclase/phosphodiesterase [Trinickia caryophylli]|uniref:Periplasmic sensor diguanylate cyclase/phosphodiesterase n=1 Tax=Trinickia caryophylli TaxID=28094 RepID=A0A1X7GGB5_TRICW|nr:periplasmic sensor diguanylate cyclase/phosphodiesterase [Trinickia caryophylli]
MRKGLKYLRRYCREHYAGGLAFGTLLLGLVATAIVYSLLGAFVQREAKLRFDNDSRSVEQQIVLRVRLYSDVLVTMRALFGADEQVSRSEFRDFVNGLDLPGRYPGFQTLNFAVRLQQADLPRFTGEQRADPLLRNEGVEFSVRSQGAGPTHEILTYVEPLEINRPALGVDMEDGGARSMALAIARDSGEAISSGRRIIAGHGPEQIGLAMRLPVYRRGMPAGTVQDRRRAYVGSVGAGIRINGMMTGLLSEETLRLMHYRIYDAGPLRAANANASDDSLLYDSVTGAAASSSSGTARRVAMVARLANDARATPERAIDRDFVREAHLPFAGRRWLIVFSADPAVLMGSQRYLPFFSLISGLVISLLLAGLAYALSSARARALQFADAITADLRESEMARAEAQRIAHLGDWRVDLDARTVHFSKEMARLIGWRRAPTLPVLVRAIEPADRRAFVAHFRNTLIARAPFEFECRYRSARGRRGWLRIIGRACGPPGARRLRGTALEITKQKAIDRVRELEHAFTLQLATAADEYDVLRELVELLTSGMDWDAGAFWPTPAGLGQRLRVVHAAHEPALASWLGERAQEVSADEVPESPHWVVGHGTKVGGASTWLAAGGMVTTFSFPLTTSREVLGVAQFYARERLHVEPQALAMARSIASQMNHFLQRRRAENNLHFLANHDALTGLPNRLMFKAHLEDSLERADAGNTALYVLFIDLDRFKDINDSLGHNVGDQLLRAVAERLAARVPEADMLARLGGDEFIMLLKEPCASEGTKSVFTTIETIQAALAQPFVADGVQLQVSASIGVSTFPSDGQDAQTLLKTADIAMYGAKQRGKNTYQLYQRQMGMSLQRRVEIEACLRRAVENREFTLFYQPRVDLRTNHCMGVEALIRWNSPTLGFVMPGDFIALAEETGAIVPIGEWVLGEACRQAAEWRSSGLGDIHVAVNLSARQFADRRLLERILEALDEAQLPGELLELELTESMVMRHPEQAVRWLTSLKRTGVHLSIDDFGTGYSSLAYLNRFPIDTVKIDRSFIRHLPESHSDAQITSAVIALGHSLGLTVIAEGAETQAQIDFLRKEGCDEVQGYFFSRPLSAGDMRVFLDRPVHRGCGDAPRPDIKDVRHSGTGRSCHT